MIAGAKLPKPVHAVGERIGLSYQLRNNEAARIYIEESKGSTRLDFGGLKKSYYSLNESRTTTKSPIKDKKTNTSREPRNPFKLNSRVRKQLYKISDEDKSKLRYETFKQINDLWKDYAKKVANERNNDSIFRMDFHGCELTCTASKNPTLVGNSGIVVQETKNTFIVIKNTNALVTLPKRESLFEFNIEDKQYRIHGCNLLFTTQLRSKIKYKQQRSVSDI